MVGSAGAYAGEQNAEQRLRAIQLRAKRDVCRIKSFLYTFAFLCFLTAFPAQGAMIGIFPKDFIWMGISMPFLILSIMCACCGPLGVMPRLRTNMLSQPLTQASRIDTRVRSLAIQPQDALAVRIACFVSIIIGFVCGPFFCLPSSLLKLTTVECANTTINPANSIHGAPAIDADLYCVGHILLWALQIPGCFLMGALAVPVMRRKNGEWLMTPYASYHRVMLITRVGFGYNGMVMVAFGIVTAYSGPEELFLFQMVSMVAFGAFCVLFAVTLTRKNLQRAHSWVKKVAARGEAREAAGVAALMGKYGPTKTLAIAKSTFRGIEFDSLVCPYAESLEPLIEPISDLFHILSPHSAHEYPGR